MAPGTISVYLNTWRNGEAMQAASAWLHVAEHGLAVVGPVPGDLAICASS